MCSLRDAAADFSDLGVNVYGISIDDVASQAAFSKKQKLNFQLLSDPDGSAARKYGALMKKRAFAKRVTFVLDGEGTLLHISHKVDVRQHGANLVALVKGLRN